MSPNFDLNNTVLFTIVIVVSFIYKWFKKEPLFDKNSLVSNTPFLPSFCSICLWALLMPQVSRSSYQPGLFKQSLAIPTIASINQKPNLLGPYL